MSNTGNNNTQSFQNPTSDDLNQELRQEINDAYAFVQGSKTTQMYSSITFEDLMDAQIQRLTGPDTPQRPNPLNRIAAIASRTVDAVAKIKQLPDNFFSALDTTDSTNTPADGDDPYNDGTSP